MSDELHILIVDDDYSMAKTLADILRVKGYQASTAHSALEALELLSRKGVDCVVSDIKMPDASGVDLYREVKSRWPYLPFVLMTAYSTDQLVREGLDEGAVACLTKPLDIDLLLDFFAFLWSRRSVAIVGPDPAFGHTLTDTLQERGFAVTQSADLNEAITKLGNNDPIVLLDVGLGRKEELAVLEEIETQHAHLPVILITAHREETPAKVERFLQGWNHVCLHKPFDKDQLLQLLTDVRRQEFSRMLCR